MVLASMAIIMRFPRAELSVSKIQSQLLKTRNDTTWKKYLQSLRGIMQSIDECAKKVKKIQTSTLVSMFGDMDGYKYYFSSPSKPNTNVNYLRA
jgi:hypothetical protein